MIKSKLRKIYKSLRKELTPEQVEDYSIRIANQLLNMDIWDYSFYHLFLSIVEQREINTDYILNILAGKDKNIVISKSDFGTNRLENFLLTDNTIIRKNEYNIPEPVDGIPISNDKIEVVFVPLLTFDVQGNRTGYGKGFYDNFLNTCSPKTKKIGLSFFEPTKIITDVNQNDILLDYCVTPLKVYSF